MDSLEVHDQVKNIGSKALLQLHYHRKVNYFHSICMKGLLTAATKMT